MASVILNTDRLILRQLTPDDSRAVYRYRSDPTVQRWQSWAPRTEAEVREFITRSLAASPNIRGTWFQFAICLRDSDELIGDCGLHFPDDGLEQVEVGITLSPDHRGAGYATEALAVLFRYVFDDLAKHRIVASIDPENVHSIRLLERLGMRREAHHLESIRFRDRWVDDLIYALLRREWAAT